MESPVNGIKSSSGVRWGCQENGIRRYSVSIDCSSCFQIVYKQKPKFGDNINQSIFLTDLHCDWEIISKFWREEQLGLLLQRRTTWRNMEVVNLNFDMKNRYSKCFTKWLNSSKIQPILPLTPKIYAKLCYSFPHTMRFNYLMLTVPVPKRLLASFSSSFKMSHCNFVHTNKGIKRLKPLR